MKALLALAPIAAVLVLMVGRGWSAVRAGAVTAIGAVALALIAFDLGGSDDPFARWEGVLGVVVEALWISLTVVAIVGPALGVHHLQQRTGSTPVLQEALGRLSPDPRVAALLIAWFFCLFLEGAAGFGTPVALASPFLVAAGFSPAGAVTAALIGHAVGVSFGALGTPVMAQVAATPFTGLELSSATVPYLAALGWVLAGALALVIAREIPGQRPPWGWAAAGAACFLVPAWLIGRHIGPELPTLGGALVGSVAFLGAIRLRAGTPRPVPADGVAPVSPVARSAAPYLALVVLVVVTRMIPPLRDALQSVEVSWTLFDRFGGTVQPLYHPGTLLTIAFAAGAVVQRASTEQVRSAVADTNRQLVTVVAALIAMVTIARAMSQSGMTDELATTAAGIGSAWPLLAPAVGALGTFVTGSATASNILFTDFQASTAEAIGRDPLPLLGAQGFGAAAGNIICPHNIVAAAATVGLTGGEGRVLRRTLPVALVYLTLGGGLALALSGA